ncbi:MAG: uroporphyrinogen decarboxylase family protein [Eubacteriaceae bacterium]|jgi:hypothetical protein
MTEQTKQNGYAERLQRVNDAIALKEPDKIPFVPFFDCIVQRMNGSSFKSNFYDYKKSGDSVVKFYQEHPICDAYIFASVTSGKANELAGTALIDWPGRPGTKVDDYSTHQVIEQEFMQPEEYSELLDDYSGFMLKKFIPRAFTNLSGLSTLNLTCTTVLNTAMLAPLYSPQMLETYRTLEAIGKADADAARASSETAARLTELGIPGFITGMSEAPFDILGDYFRGTIGLMEDMFEYEDEIAQVCDMFADQQIAALQYFNTVPMPVKRVFFPLHKGMDGFMSPAQYEKLYWKPLKKVMDVLIDMGVTPFIYSEGKYETRLDVLTDVPKGKVLYHFEDVDMANAKKKFEGIACISGNLPVQMLEFGTPEKVADYCKYLIDTCAPGGGYIFDFNGSLENAKPECMDAMFNTFENYQ